MQIKNVLAKINRMQRDGVIASYAIGEAVGATFYLEPSATLDIDIFVAFETRPGSRLISLQPIYDYLTGRGHAVRGEYIEIAGWPVQFLPRPARSPKKPFPKPGRRRWMASRPGSFPQSTSSP